MGNKLCQKKHKCTWGAEVGQLYGGLGKEVLYDILGGHSILLSISTHVVAGLEFPSEPTCCGAWRLKRLLQPPQTHPAVANWEPCSLLRGLQVVAIALLTPGQGLPISQLDPAQMKWDEGLITLLPLQTPILIQNAVLKPTVCLRELPQQIKENKSQAVRTPTKVP